MQGVPYHQGYRTSMSVLLEVISQFFLQAPTLQTIVIYMMSRRNLSRKRDDLDAVIAAETEFCDRALPLLCEQLDARVIPVGLSNLEDVLAASLTAATVERYTSAFRGVRERTTHHKQRTVYLLAGYDPFDELTRVASRADMTRISVDSLEVPLMLDLVVRTGNVRRLSDFVPLQAGYAELFFLDKMFPDVTPQDVGAILEEYHSRVRTFGS